MLLALILSILGADPCRGLYIADPDRDICPVDQAGPMPYEGFPDDWRTLALGD